MRVIEAPQGTKGFDCDAIVTYEHARLFMDAGYRLAIRYVGRNRQSARDLRKEEVNAILSAGLALNVVQHVELPGWIPSTTKGETYGRNAAEFAYDAGVPVGTMLWLDLEGVRKPVPEVLVIDYCNRWYRMVAGFGYTPGLYVGYDPGISAENLYWRLRFEHYWRAYNLNGDQYPVVRGFQMLQTTSAAPKGVPYSIDRNDILRDHKGGLPLVCAPDEWDIPILSR